MDIQNMSKQTVAAIMAVFMAAFISSGEVLAGGNDAESTELLMLKNEKFNVRVALIDASSEILKCEDTYPEDPVPPKYWECIKPYDLKMDVAAERLAEINKAIANLEK